MKKNKTRKLLSFWGHFEETALEKKCDSSNMTQTHTRQDREEPDHRNACLFVVTRTKTATREEPDQEVGSKRYSAIPSYIPCGTSTLTEQREEPEQDESSHKYTAIPMNIKG